MNKYEVMFLFDPGFASDEESVQNEISRLAERAGAEIIAKHRWDERKLAYEIKRRKRGVYFLVYLRAPGSGIRTLERDVQLSEGILRILVLRADHISEEKMQQPVTAPAETPRRPWDDSGRGPRRRDDRRDDRPSRDRADRGPRDVKADAPAAPAEAATPKPTPKPTPEPTPKVTAEPTPAVEPVGAAQESKNAGGSPSEDAAGPGTEAEPSQA